MDSIKKTDKNNGIFILSILLVTAFRYMLISAMFILFSPGSIYDDLLQISKAMSVSNGNWLGEYGPLTLVKGVGYPIMTAFFHRLKIPYLTGFNSLYIVGCLLFLYAITEITDNKFLLFSGYSFVLFNPIAFSSVINRYYRDVMYYAVCMIFISLVLICFLKRNKKLSGFLAGFFLALCALTREDSQHLYIYIVCMIIACVIVQRIVTGKLKIRDISFIGCIVAGYLVLILSVCCTNYVRYNTFTTDEYNSGAYAKAYGAITRLDGGVEDSHIAIPFSEREKLYEYSPSFALLKEQIDGAEGGITEWKDVQNEYISGYFSFALRMAVYNIGYYRDSQSTNEYLEKMAAEVNDYRDNISRTSYGKRNGIVSRFYSWQIPDIVKNTVRGIYRTSRYTAVSCIPVQCNEDDKYLRIYEDYTLSTVAADRYMESGETLDNYHLSGIRLWMQRGMRALTIIYSVLTPVLLLLSIAYVSVQTIGIIKLFSVEKIKKWILSCSLISLFITRCRMVAFVHVTTFSAIYNPCYQGCSYTVMGIFISVQMILIINEILKHYGNKQNRRHLEN